MTRNTWQFLIPLSIPTERNEVKFGTVLPTGCRRPPAAGQHDVEPARADRKRAKKASGYRARRDTDPLGR